jgi:predicted transcriptional regulator
MIAFIMSSDLMRDIMTLLKDGERTPAQLSEELNIPRERVRRALGQLERTRMVVCLTPRRRKGKVYAITEQGHSTLEEVRKTHAGREVTH